MPVRETLTDAWEMVNVVLQTCPLFKSHTGSNIVKVLQAAVIDWELKRPNYGISIVTDKVSISLEYLRLGSVVVASSQLCIMLEVKFGQSLFALLFELFRS